VAVGHLQLGVINLRLIGAHRAIELVHQRFLRVDLLLRNTAGRDQRSVPLQIELSVAQGGFIFKFRRFHLVQRRLVGARIDQDQQVSLLHILAFFEIYLHDLSVNPALDIRRIERGHRSQAGQVNGNILLLHLRHCHRNRSRS